MHCFWDDLHLYNTGVDVISRHWILEPESVGAKDRRPVSGGAVKDRRPEAHGLESETGPRQTEQSYGRVNQRGWR